MGSAASLRAASKEPEFTPMPDLVRPVAPVATKGAAEEPTVIVTNLQGVVIYGKLEDVKGGGIENGVKGVDIHSAPPWLQQKSFAELLGREIGRSMTASSLSALQTAIVNYCRAHDHMIIDVITPEQDVKGDTIQIAVIEAKVGKVTVENHGRAWFSRSTVLRETRLKAGDTVRESRLNDDLNLMNRNNYASLGYDAFSGSFHDVRANFHQGGLGETDVKLEVEDRFPLRPFVGFEDSGIESIGRYRLVAGFNWANVFSLEHRLNYEYLTDSDFNKFREHVVSYIIPLPWRHELTLFGAYADVNPDFSTIDPTLASLQNKGTFWQTSARYTIPLPSIGKYNQEIIAGFDFKRTDTPLLFEASGIASALRTNKVDVGQFILGYGGRHKDTTWGATAFSIQAVYSPGGIGENNNDAAYNEFRSGAKSEYFYGRAELRHETPLPLVALPESLRVPGTTGQFSWYTRAAGQLSETRLVATEVFSIGGYDTVRGYDERIVSGDGGWLVNNELRTPPIFLGNLTCKPGSADWIQFLLFTDWGAAVTKHTDTQNERAQEVLLSVGAGLRYALADNVHVRFDYGFALDREYLTAPNASSLGTQAKSRAHVGLEVSY